MSRPLFSSQKSQKGAKGFTLAELLISLLILAEIATFTIPKVLSAQQNTANNAKAMEFAATISAAYQKLQLEGTVTNDTGPYSLLPYINYAYFNTSATIDTQQNSGTQPCSPCIDMHDGSRAAFGNSGAFGFGGSNANNAIFFMYDPDGKVTDGTTNGPGKSVIFILFRNGRITSAGKYADTYCQTGGCRTAAADQDPPWLRW